MCRSIDSSESWDTHTKTGKFNSLKPVLTILILSRNSLHHNNVLNKAGINMISILVESVIKSGMTIAGRVIFHMSLMLWAINPSCLSEQIHVFEYFYWWNTEWSFAAQDTQVLSLHTIIKQMHAQKHTSSLYLQLFQFLDVFSTSFHVCSSSLSTATISILQVVLCLSLFLSPWGIHVGACLVMLMSGVWQIHLHFLDMICRLIDFFPAFSPLHSWSCPVI